MAAAQAGYKVAAFDIFNDDETRRFSFVSKQINYRDVGFDADDLWNNLTATLSEGTAIAYGGGLEGQPELLQKIARNFQLIGNSPDTVGQVKQPNRLFPLLETLRIPYPETRLDHPLSGGWLSKKAGGSGGTHIRMNDEDGDYFQQYVEGLPVSILFLADGLNIEIVGYNEQWLAPVSGMPFRYGGIVSNTMLSGEAKTAMAETASRVVSATGLKGLNSMDFILPADGVPLLLEVNPRLSASFSLYDDLPGLFRQHLNACQQQLPRIVRRASSARAATVYYADADLMAANVEWPAWTTDRPVDGTYCGTGSPVCTVLAEAVDAESAKQLVFARARELDAQLRTFTIPPGK